MEITVKDIVYLLTYIISMITLFLTFRNRQYNISKGLKLLSNIVFGEKGSLNVIDQRTFNSQLDQIWTRIRQNEMTSNMMLQKIEELNRNVLAIMITLNVRIPKAIPNGETNDG